ncbi:MAG TPA: indole-3-glycerol phosphate synthase TrpC [Nitrospirota bacterium]|nr:indole-3-glycerol phosphate synthase TrpC [Nitrospirota bacterium]
MVHPDPDFFMILDEIVAHKKEELAATKRRVSFADLRKKAADAGPARGFGKALASGSGIRLIAEVKKASPSKGVIREDFDPVSISRVYEESGAACLSVLTEQRYFQGRLEYLGEVRAAVGLPLLRKDFIIDEYQLFEAKAAGADAVLLIAACLGKDQMTDYLGIAHDLGLDVLAESHTYEELAKTLLAGVSLVGINNRDLSTFSVNLRTTIDMLKDVPEDKIVVSESGITTRDDVTLLEQAGVDAILVGESLMREKNIGKKVKELLGKV